MAVPARSCLPLLFVLLLPTCSDEPPKPRLPQALPALHFDFGTIEHGKAAQHDFELDLAGLGGDFAAIAVQSDCSCTRHQLWLRDAQGRERPAEGVPLTECVPRAGELLIVRLQVDSLKHEPVDLGPVDSRATVVLQPVTALHSSERRYWPLQFRYAVDSPVRLRPHAVLDFERVPQSTRPELLATLHSDLPDRPIRFGPAACSDPRVQLSLEPDGDGVRLRARFCPGQQTGNFRELVTVGTDLPSGYVVNLAAIGKVVADLEAVPMAKLSLSTDLGQEQPAAKAQSQYILVTDHDRSRAPEFVVAGLVDGAGRDASRSFEVRLEPVPGDERTQRLFVRYLGGVQREFRGQLLLAKDARAGPFLAIELVAFDRKQP